MLIKKLGDYVKRVLKQDMDFQPWSDTSKLPLVIREQYSFYLVDLFNSNLLFAVAMSELPAPNKIAKHLAAINSVFRGTVVFVSETVTAYQRSQLIEMGIQFAVPDRQLFLPGAGLDLRENFPDRKLTILKKFYPVTQVAFLYAMYQPAGELLTPTMIANITGYSLMSMTRAFEELRLAGIGCHEERWKERCWSIDNKAAAWEKALPFLRDPKKKALYCKNIAQLKVLALAGQSALAEYTMMMPGANTVVATTREIWKARFAAMGCELAQKEPEAITVELWAYDPQLFAKNGCVDALSLYLSECEHGDERAEKELEGLLKQAVD
ncbi:MAG: hypothetical protein WCP79_15540 [Bacillota bacterium]